MQRKKNTDSFWTGYVDVMTNLFAITLVLFVVSFFWFKKTNDRLKVTEIEYNKIQRLTKAIQSLNNNPYFTYSKEYQKHILNLPIQFRTGYDFYKIPEHLVEPNKVYEIKKVGESIIKTIKDLRKEYTSVQDSYRIKFLVVIEGQASKIGNEYRNYILSYQRALSLKQLWDNVSDDDGTKITADELNCEVVVSGSGWYGKPREVEDKKNQRFLVHIVPVIEWDKDGNKGRVK